MVVKNKIVIPVKPAISALSLGLKMVALFLVQRIVFLRFPVEKAALWGELNSLFVVLSLADFGVGQSTMTGIINQNQSSFTIQNQLLVSIKYCFSAGVVLSLIVWPYIVFKTESDVLTALIFGIAMGARIWCIPFGAILSAHGRYHERKIIELIGVCASSIVACILAFNSRGFLDVIFAFNIVYTATNLMAIPRALNLVPGIRVIDVLKANGCRRVLVESFPYFLSNLSTLFIYGGFVWVLSFLLSKKDTARIAVIHPILFMGVYQIYDAAIRAVQYRLHLEDESRKYYRLHLILSFLLSVLVFLVSDKLMLWYSKGLTMGFKESASLSIFLFVELQWLFFQIKMQVQNNQSRKIRNLSILRLVVFLLQIVIAGISGAKIDLFSVYIANSLLSGGLFVVYRVYMVDCKAK